MKVYVDFWRNVAWGRSTECWEWLVGTTRYGMLWADGRRVYAHRVAYEMAHGQIPKGLELDHTCRNTRCVNPRHLEAVTHLENVRRGANRRVAAHREGRCLRGHLFSIDNIRRKRDGTKQCRRCINDRQRERRSQAVQQ